MIQKSCNKWFASDDCRIKNLISYMNTAGELRDAQIEAIKIYLFLKIACDNKPLYELFCNGTFTSLKEEDINNLELSNNAREILLHNKAALSLYEYATQKNEKGETVQAQMSGVPARIVQHETDHLDGVLFIDYLSGVKREMLMRKVNRRH